MPSRFQQLMNRATRLTRSGNLSAATSAIQTALRGGTSTDSSRQEVSDIIDVEAREIPDSKAYTPSQSHYEDAGARMPQASTHGDSFTAGSFCSSSGQRNYKLYVPPHAGDRPLPLVVMLHGCTQDADDFAAGTAMNDAARVQGFYVLYPIQSRKANQHKCWNWFKHNHQQKGRGEPSILAGMTKSIVESHAIDPQRVYVAGMSAGGAMAAILASVYPELYAAAGVHSGLAPGVASDLPSALSAMKGVDVQGRVSQGSGVPTIVFHGDRDSTVHPANAHGVVMASTGAGVHVETSRISGSPNRRSSTRHMYRNSAGEIIAERWEVHGAGHAWSGGTPNGSYMDQTGPDATGEMLRFFLERTLRE